MVIYVLLYKHFCRILVFLSGITQVLIADKTIGGCLSEWNYFYLRRR